MHSSPKASGSLSATPCSLQLRQQVVGVEHRGLRRIGQPLGAERADVGVGAHEAPVVALEAAQAADRLLVAVVVEVERAVVGAHDPRVHQVGLHPLGDRDRARARAAAAVRLREGLVQVEVHDVEAHVARARLAHDGVEVRAVVVERRPHVVDDLGDLRDVGVEHAQRVGVGQHQAGDGVVGLGPEVVEVHPAVGVRADLDDRHARHRHRRRVGPVRGVGRQHLGPDLPAVLVEGARQQHARQLAVRPGARLQRDVRQAGDLAQRALQVVHQLQRALRALRRLQRVQPRVAGQRSDPLVQPRVVLHRARPERVEARVEVEVAARELDVVAHQLGLGDLGQARGRVTAQRRRQQLGGLDLGHVERGRDERAAARGALLEDRRRAVALHRRRAIRRHRNLMVQRMRLDPRIAVELVVVEGGHAEAPTAARSAATAVPSTSASRSMSAFERCSVKATNNPSGNSS